MKKIFLLLTVCAFALCFSSFHTNEEKPPVSDNVFIVTCLISSPTWQAKVKELSSNFAKEVYFDMYSLAETDPIAAKKVALAKQMLNSKPGDAFNLYLVSYFTNDTFLLGSQITEIVNSLDSAIQNNFNALAGVAP